MHFNCGAMWNSAWNFYDLQMRNEGDQTTGYLFQLNSDFVYFLSRLIVSIILSLSTATMP